MARKISELRSEAKPKKTRLTDDQWAAIRAAYEQDPALSYEAAAERAAKAGNFCAPTKGRISQRSTQEGGWAKKGDLNAINQAAQRLADAAKLNDEVNPFTPGKVAAREESERVRADVIVRHRREWLEIDGYRKAALLKMKQAIGTGAGTINKDEWMIAKMAAETLRTNLSALEIKQANERKAFGLDDKGDEDASGAVRIVIEREHVSVP